MTDESVALEREACAKLAEDMFDGAFNRTIGSILARAIRTREPRHEPPEDWDWPYRHDPPAPADEVEALRGLLSEIGAACAIADVRGDLPDVISGELYSRCIRAGLGVNEEEYQARVLAASPPRDEMGKSHD